MLTYGVRDHAAIFQPVRSAQHYADRFAVDAVLFFQNSGRERFYCIVIEHRHGGLNNDRPGIKILIHEVDRTAGNLDTVLERLVLRIESLECRQQRWMNVQYAIRKSPHEVGAQQAHETSQADQLHVMLSKLLHQLAIVDFPVETFGG